MVGLEEEVGVCVARLGKLWIQITRLSNTEHFCPHHIHRNLNQMKWVKNNPSLFYQRTKSCTQNAVSFAGSQWPLCLPACPGSFLLSCYVCKLHLYLWGKGWGPSSLSWTCLENRFITSSFSRRLPNMVQVPRHPCPVCIHLALHIVSIHLFIHSINMHSLPTMHRHWLLWGTQAPYTVVGGRGPYTTVSEAEGHKVP